MSDVSCTIKMLPESEWTSAASRAVEINPTNAPAVTALRAASPGAVIQPQHLALLTSKYWGARGIRLTVGFLVKQLASHGWNVHRARLATFLGCSLLTALGSVAALVSKGPLLLGLLLLIGAGALGLFPNYYAFGQEISKKNQGLVVGSLATFAWLATGLMQNLVGQTIQATGSYVASMAFMGLAPFLSFLILWWFWDRPLRGK